MGPQSAIRRRRSRLLVVASIIVVILAIGLILENMPGSGPTVATAPPPPAASKVTPFGQAFTRGIEAMRLGDAHAAALAFDEARAINPHIPQAHINLGFAYLAMKRPREAATAFDRAVTIDPKQINAYYGLGAALDAAGDRKGAIGAMRTYEHLAAADDPFKRKALSALWEWEAAEKSVTPQQGSAEPTGLAANAAAAPDQAASKGEASPHSGAVAKAQSGALAAKAEPPPGDGSTKVEVPQKSGAEQKAELPKVAALDATPRNQAGLAPLPAISQTPEALTPAKGVISIVNFWASWCGPCRAEMPSLQAFAAALDPARYRLVGLNIDRDRDFAREFMRDTGVSFDNYWDGKGTFARERFQVEAYPQTLFVDSSGAVLARVVGAREWPIGASEATVQEILAAGRQKKEQQ